VGVLDVPGRAAADVLRLGVGPQYLVLRFFELGAQRLDGLAGIVACGRLLP
jgi:hypothetical protein